jgi:hypothetical protein
MKPDKVLNLMSMQSRLKSFDWQPFYAIPRANIIGSLVGRVARAHAHHLKIGRMVKRQFDEMENSGDGSCIMDFRRVRAFPSFGVIELAIFVALPCLRCQIYISSWAAHQRLVNEDELQILNYL